MNRSRLAELLPFSFQSSPFSSSVGAFSLLIRVEVAREQSVPPCHSRESVYSRDCCHSQQGRLGFQEKTSNWEGDPPGELTVPQTDTGEQVEYTRALERTMSKELGKMTP